MHNRRSVLAGAAMTACLSSSIAKAESIAAAAPLPSPRNRGEATAIIADLRRIVAPEGIERVQSVKIGGIHQFVSIRSRNAANPPLLVLHGGPGFVAMPASWWSAHGWDEFFTVVQWDQRGAGKTHAANSPDAIAPTMTVERMQADVEEMVQWVRENLGHDKIFVLGHSWGSLLGLTLAHRRPEWLHAYVGVGQAVDAMESERRGWRWTLEQARARSNDKAVRDLMAIAPYAEDEVPHYSHVLRQRRWLGEFGGAAYGRPNASFEGAAFALSPEYSDDDMRAVWVANNFSVKHLLSAALAMDLSYISELEVPLFLFLGRHDINVSSAVAAEWYERVAAPEKHLIWFEQSAHEIMVEEPGKLFASLITRVLPSAIHRG